MVYLVRGLVIAFAFLILTSPAVFAKKKADNKPAASTGDLSGRYEKGNKENGGLLLLKRIDNNDYKFYLDANWTSSTTGQDNTGLGFGKITLNGNTATYNSDSDPTAGFQLSFDFSKPEKCKVNCVRPENFGEKNVNPNGDYRRTSKKAPADSEFKE